MDPFKPIIKVYETPVLLHTDPVVTRDHGFMRIAICLDRGYRGHQINYSVYLKDKLEPGLYRVSLVGDGRRLEHDDFACLRVPVPRFESEEITEHSMFFMGESLGSRYDVEIRRIRTWVIAGTKALYVGSDDPVFTGAYTVSREQLLAELGTVIDNFLDDPIRIHYLIDHRHIFVDAPRHALELDGCPPSGVLGRPNDES